MYVHIHKGLGSDSQYYVTLDRVVVVVPKVTLFRLGLAFYHVAKGNWRVDDIGVLVEVPDLRVVVLGGSSHRKSSKTSVSSKHQDLSRSHTLQRVSSWLLYETLPGRALLSLLERWTGLAVVDADWLNEQVVVLAEG